MKHFRSTHVVKASCRRLLYLHFLVHTRLNTWLKNVDQSKASYFNEAMSLSLRLQPEYLLFKSLKRTQSWCNCNFA